MFFFSKKQKYFVILRQKQINSTMLKTLIPVKSPRVPPTTASCSVNVYLTTLDDLITVLVGVSIVRKNKSLV